MTQTHTAKQFWRKRLIAGSFSSLKQWAVWHFQSIQLKRSKPKAPPNYCKTRCLWPVTSPHTLLRGRESRCFSSKHSLESKLSLPKNCHFLWVGKRVRHIPFPWAVHRNTVSELLWQKKRNRFKNILKFLDYLNFCHSLAEREKKIPYSLWNCWD